MSNSTPNTLRVSTGASIPNTTSATAPSLTNPSANASFVNQMVTVTAGADQGDIYYVDNTGKAVKLYDTTQSTGSLPVAFSIGTQAQLDSIPVADRVTGGYYILNDASSAATNKGDVLEWADTNGDGVGDVWRTAIVPVNNDQWVVLTNAAGPDAGTYAYDISSDTWTKVSEINPVIPPVDDPTAVGGIKFTTQRGSYQANFNGPLFILYDSVAGFGSSISAATEEGSLGGVSANQRVETVRKATYTNYQQDTPFTQLTNYRPFFVDAHQNNAGAIALDHKGVVYLKGTQAFMAAMSNAQSGLSSVFTPSYTPDKFWAERAVKAVKIAISPNTNDIMVLAGDGTLWVKGTNGANGIYGDNTTTVNTLWHQCIIPQQGYKKIGIAQGGTHAYALSTSGEVYLWGNNASNRILQGAAVVVPAPFKPAVLPAIEDVATDTNSTMVITTTGNRFFIGVNTNGKFGNGNTNNTVVWTDGSTFNNGFSFKKVFANEPNTSVNSTGYSFITTDNRAVYTGLQNLNRGIAGKTTQDNVLTPTLMGNGAYQSTVVDIRAFPHSALIHTNQGEIWTVVNGNGSAYAEHGWGVNAPANNNIGLNVFKKAMVPAPVVSLYSVNNDAAAQSTSHTVLTTEGRVYNWGGDWGDLTNSQLRRRAPYEVPVSQFRQGEPKENDQKDLMNITGSISAVTPLTVTNIVDGGSSQTVTATFTATGTPGKVTLTGSTVSGPDTTFVSWLTNTVYLNSTTENVTVQFTVNAADIPSLVAPNTQAQNWTVVLSANGTPVTFNISGTRITDALAGAMTASAAAYAAAAPGDIIRITASEYNAVKAALDSPTVAYASDSFYTTATTGAYGLQVGTSSATDGTNMIPFVAGHYPVLARTRVIVGVAYTAAKVGIAAGTSMTSSGVLLTNENSLTMTTATNTEEYFLVKQPSVQVPAGNLTPRIKLPAASYHKEPSGGGSRLSTETTSLTVAMTTTFAAQPTVQIITTPTKKW